MYFKLLFISITFLSLIISSCTDENSSNSITETPVVEGFLFADQPIDTLKITQSFSYASGNTELISLNDLEVWINTDVNQVPLENIGNGIYQNLDFIPQSGTSYQLSFSHRGEAITSETYIPEKKTICHLKQFVFAQTKSANKTTGVSEKVLYPKR